MTFQLEKRLISVSDYHKMGEAGILTEAEKVELLNGEIIRRSPVNSKHRSHVRRLTALLYGILKEDSAIISIKKPIVIPDFSEPEPDVTIVRFDPNFYSENHPYPKDVFILIEVSDSTLLIDREVKLPIYATAKIKEYWIVNLVENCIEVYKNPTKDNYKLKN